MPYDISSKHSELARAIFAVIGTSPLGLDEAIRATVAMEVDRPEWSFLKGEQRWISRPMSQAAVVGNFSALGIFNRDSGSIVVVTGFQNTSPLGAGAINFAHQQLPDPTLEALVNSDVPVSGLTDVRWMRGTGIEANAAAREVTLDAVGFALTPYGRVEAGPTNQPYPPRGFEPLAILAPNQVVLAVATIANQAMSGVFFGYVKPLAQRNRA